MVASTNNCDHSKFSTNFTMTYVVICLEVNPILPRVPCAFWCKRTCCTFQPFIQLDPYIMTVLPNLILEGFDGVTVSTLGKQDQIRKRIFLVWFQIVPCRFFRYLGISNLLILEQVILVTIWYIVTILQISSLLVPMQYKELISTFLIKNASIFAMQV